MKLMIDWPRPTSRSPAGQTQSPRARADESRGSAVRQGGRANSLPFSPRPAVTGNPCPAAAGQGDFEQAGARHPSPTGQVADASTDGVITRTRMHTDTRAHTCARTHTHFSLDAGASKTHTKC